MGSVDAGRLFLEALTCAGERADLNAASNFDTTCAAVPAGALACTSLTLRVRTRSYSVERTLYFCLDSALTCGLPSTYISMSSTCSRF